MITVTLHYSEPLIQKAIKLFWWKSMGWLSVIAFLLVAVSLGLSLWQGDRSWWVGVSASVLVFFVIFGIFIYLVHYRNSMQRFRRLKEPVATLVMADDWFRVSSDIGSSEFKWEVVYELWCFKEIWLLFFSRAQFMTLPVADLPQEARDFLIQKMQQNQLKIKT